VTPIYVGLAILLEVWAFLSYPYRYPCDIKEKQAARDTPPTYDALADLLESIEHFLLRLEIYTRIPLTPAMDDMLVKIMVELLSILALATRELKQGRLSESIPADLLPYIDRMAVKFAKKLFGQNDVEAVLQRLDRLTQEEARITAAQTLEVVYSLVSNTNVVMHGEKMYSP
jgi:hypothetical protein